MCCKQGEEICTMSNFAFIIGLEFCDALGLIENYDLGFRNSHQICPLRAPPPNWGHQVEVYTMV